ncbi:MAG: hypothetical protein JKY56_14220 [Kofleriaceae bacterium]|nr:hypothetical protein [Kofleriaceae bacterium]
MNARPLALFFIALSLVTGAEASAKDDGPSIRQGLEGNSLTLSVSGLPALSADGRTLIAPAESRYEDLLVETLQATKWGGIRASYDFESGPTDEMGERQRANGAKRLEKMIAQRKFRKVSITKANRSQQVRFGEFVVEVKNGRLRFFQGKVLIYTRKIATRQSRGAGLMSDDASDNLKVDFVGAYIDPTRRVFVVSYGSGECDCACDVAPFYQLYRWGEQLP